MQAEELFHILHHQPFQPFRVHLKDGRFYDIRREEDAVVGKTYFAIGIPLADQPDPFIDYVDTVGLGDIDRVERLTGSATVASNE